jgi:SAM-dependent methyltransferase
LGLTPQQAALVLIPYSAGLPFGNEMFDFVLANGVFEHIPPPRSNYVREVWRVLKPGGCLIISESPNKYLPKDYHTTGGLWFIPWLPSRLARRYAVWRGRFGKGKDWVTSGWRGVGYYEIVSGFSSPYKLLPERTRSRHMILTKLGLPASLLDPYPILVFQKPS